MVSQEEYEYSAFKCAFCKVLNPAKKLRPIAPRIPLPVPKETSDTSNKKIAADKPVLSEQSSSVPASDKDSSKQFFF